ncbi:Os06g0549050 [Oryza sativa Japonica Group]|uniref:Os06g0549050 protein n=1 Tax=Oryza sativa subsp. japonica TaxID=39947 RepID=A0A0N7KM92_ORYSJ|nr:Os06g0549050 [Oryza sativa Japonica Group]
MVSHVALDMGAVDAQLREAAGHQREERVAGAEVEALEHGLLRLRHHADHQVFRERRREGLPLGEEVDGALVHHLGHLDHRHRRRHRQQPQLPRHHDPEARAAAAADGP